MGAGSSLPAFLREGASGRDDRPALLVRGSRGYAPISYGDLWRRVDALARGFQACGVRAGERVAIFLPNGPEWILTDLALLSLGAVDVPFHLALTPSQTGALLADAGCTVAVVDRQTWNALRAGGLDTGGEGAPLRLLVSAGGPVDAPEGGRALAWEELLARGGPALAGEPGPDDLATILYTSGTTGVPKGVMLTHGNFVANVRAAREAVPLEPDDLFFSLLPVAHVFERTAGHYAPLSTGAAIAYPASADSTSGDMREARPTVVLAVPRFFEKVRARVEESLEAAPAPRRRLMRWAIGVGLREAAAMHGRSKPVPRALDHRVADLLVLRRFRARLGGRVRFFISGGAPLAPEVEDFFWGAGLPVLQGYGLTETSPVAHVNRLGAARAGTVGPAIPGVQVRIAGDGEILLRGLNIMRGYWRQPEETARVLDADGWLHTGDVGALSADGYLSITDRTKDLIVLSTGRKVAPQGIELAIGRSPWVSQVLVVGERRPFVTAFVVPDFARLAARFPSLPREAAAREEEFARNEEMKELFRREIGEAVRFLAPHEKVRRVRLLGREFRAEDEEVTPTLKLRRHLLAQRHRGWMDALYERDARVIEIG